ncbi:MAG TPA: NTP transferase domain-containing protein [Terriglobales bacterium]|nr:NTP transferase domain-containing protein [Terriglobales bacterium]
MKLVIPMSGAGERFVKAGYREPKPLIAVDGRPMIEHVLALYPGADDVVFIVSEAHVADGALLDVLARARRDARVVMIAAHKRGPVHAVCQALDLLADDEEVIVSYCDFGMVWDFADFLRTVRAAGADGAIPAYRGFHPHSLGPTLYAYMRAEGPWLREIREKGHFTDDRMQEPASVGMYYFRRGADVKRFFPELMARGLAVNGEYYVSVVYTLMTEAGRRTYVYDVERFLQWGTPEDLADYHYWSAHFRTPRTRAPLSASGATTNIVLLAGRGQRFVDAGYTTPKPFISVAGLPMLARVVRDLPPARRWVFVCLAEHAAAPTLREAADAQNAAEIVALPALTEGQAMSALAGLATAPPDAPVLIAACDAGAVWDAAAHARLLDDPAVDVVVWTFRGHPALRLRPRAWGWVATDGTRVRRVSVKVPLSDDPARDHAIVGTFWFRRARDLTEAIVAMRASQAQVNGEYYLDEAINACLAAGLRVHVFEVERYLGWGTPDDLRTYEYWHRHFLGPA